MDIIVSIVIPAYNTEKYIKECLKSCINQTYKKFEIIFIDDCSNDDTLNIASEILKSSECQYTIIKKQKRKGVSNSRNLGISTARGKYIYFLDSDDLIKDNTLEVLMDIVVENDYKIVYGNYSRNINDLKAEIKNDYNIYNTSIYSLKGLLWSGVIWNAIIDLNLIKENSIKFDERLSYGEDLAFKIELLKYVDKVVVLNENLYYWREVENSLSDATDSSRFIEKEYNLLLKFKAMLDNGDKNSNYNTNLIKLIRIKKNSIYNTLYEAKGKIFDDTQLYNIKIPLKKIILSNLKKTDKIMEVCYSIFDFLDRYNVWCILIKIRKISRGRLYK